MTGKIRPISGKAEDTCDSVKAGGTNCCGSNPVRSAPPTPGGSSSAVGRAPMSLLGSRSIDLDDWVRWDPRTLLGGSG